MKNDNKAIIYMLIDSFSYSLIPVLAVMTVNEMHSVPYLLIALLLSVITYAVYFFYNGYLSKIKITREILKYSFIGGITFVLSQLILIYSINHSRNVYLPSVIFQIYPLVIIYFLIKFKLSNEAFTKSKFFIMLIALLGIGILNYDSTISLEKYNVFSIILPTVSAVFLGVSVAYVVKLTHLLEKLNMDSALSPLLSNFYSRIFSVVAMIPFMIWYMLSDHQIKFTINNSLVVIVYGVFCMAIGSIFYYRAIRITRKSLSIHMISYLSIVMSMLWLWLLNVGTITAFILIGSAYIIVANILLNFSIEKNYAFTGSIIWTLFIGTFIFFNSGTQIDEYYNAITAPLIFYAITLAFLMDRIFKRTDEEEGYIISIVNNILKSDAQDKKELADEIIALNESESNENTLKIYERIKYKTYCLDTEDVIDKLVLSKMQKVKFSELFVLFLTAALALYVLIFFKTADGAMYDIFKLCLSTAIVFNLFYVFDNEKLRGKKFIFTEEKDGKIYSTINTKLNGNEKSATEKSISIILLIGVFIIFFMAFHLK
jgi:drug/metabolite transporter (DMT)-like permease